jgi:hypothetical protein
MAFTIEDRHLLELLDASDPSCVHVRGSHEALELCAEILGERDSPIVGLTLDADGVPVLRSAAVRAVVGPLARIYLVEDDELLTRMRRTLGSGLALAPGTARVWWPGAGTSGDTGEHPSVLVLEDEPPAAALAEFALRFDLSRPHVHAHVHLIEEARALLEHELACAQAENAHLHDTLRDAQIECHILRDGEA